MALTDNELIEKIRNGETRHYSLIMTRYKDKAYSLAKRIVGNSEDAEEALQDAFIRAYNGLGKFENRAKLARGFTGLCIIRASRKLISGPISLNESSLRIALNIRMPKGTHC
ncbi:MAG: RNA polymerase sigma factor [Bacteroidota bacterium]